MIDRKLMRDGLAGGVGLLVLAFSGDRVRLGVAPGLTVKIGLAVFDRDGANADVGIAHGIQRIAGSYIQDIPERQFGGQSKFVIGDKIELPRSIKVGGGDGISIDIDAGPIGGIVNRRMGRQSLTGARRNRNRLSTQRGCIYGQECKRRRGEQCLHGRKG